MEQGRSQGGASGLLPPHQNPVYAPSMEDRKIYKENECSPFHRYLQDVCLLVNQIIPSYRFLAFPIIMHCSFFMNRYCAM